MRRLFLLLFVASVLQSCVAPPRVAQVVHIPLVGAHATVTCSGCHSETLYDEVPTSCSGCHEADRPDPHDPGECNDCHTVSGWELDAIDHSFFPLVGGHADPECVDCHADQPFDAASSVCSTCHAPPNGHFPGACDDCHDTRDWDDAEFDHDPFFPLPHDDVSACESCHVTGDYAVFSCIDCHEHRRSEMDDEHDDVGNYQWNSDACLSCHPNGEEDD